MRYVAFVIFLLTLALPGTSQAQSETDRLREALRTATAQVPFCAAM